MPLAQTKKSGRYYIGKSEEVLKTTPFRNLRGKINLIFTSPPFPLNSKKSYGNMLGEEYRNWFSSLAPLFAEMLTNNGSIVIELGNSWEPSRPVQSLLPLQCLLDFVSKEDTGLRLIQEFICYNPSRLPSPAAWVTSKRIRTVDSYTRLWWIAKNDFPKADNAKVLRPYSQRMKYLLATGRYNAGKRPSEHKIGEKSFLHDCGGSIAHNLFELENIDPDREVRLPNNVLSFSNSNSNDFYSKTCKKKGITPHPARMPIGLANFFIEFLTDPEETVLDPFAGSNTTGYAATLLGRKWLAIDAEEKYVEHSKIRFEDPALEKTRGSKS
ncbi:site-specific DNA-methyltransferase [Pleurocapsales cyanobacterium LEGE 06147]|nr:site-specific DNA-methyltransferase [Pleurocapsales cyanobacterium LEGE 06147]